MFLIPNVKKFRCCLCSFSFILVLIFLSLRFIPNVWKNFYATSQIKASLPGIGSAVELNDCKVTIKRVEKIPNQQNPKSDFETLLVEMDIESKLKINKLIFNLVDIWIEDKFGNKFEVSNTDRRNQILQDSEVIPDGTLQVKTYFSVPKYTNELYLLVKPKLSNNPIKIQL